MDRWRPKVSPPRRRGRGLLLWTLALALAVFSVFHLSESCGVSKFNATTVSETDLPVMVLQSFPAMPNVSWKLDLVINTSSDGRPDIAATKLSNFMRSRVILNTTTGTEMHEVQLINTIDLEEAYDNVGMKLGVLKYSIVCMMAGAPNTPYEWFLAVRSVNEFAPQFVGDPFDLTIPENTDPEVVVMTLRDNATDRDVISSKDSDILEFGMQFIPSWPDDSHGSLLYMVNRQSGQIKVAGAKPDFESFPNSSLAFVTYNVTVYDTDRKTNWTTLTVSISDVDDLPPRFVYPGCTSDTCVAAYTCEVSANYTGPIGDLRPAPVQARDGDSLGYPIRYSLKSGPQQPRFRSYVQIDQDRGNLSIVAPLYAYRPAPEISIVLEAEERPPSSKALRQTSTVPLIIRIRYSDGVQSTAAPQGGVDSSTTGGISSTAIIVIVVLTVVVFLTVVVVGVLILYVKKRADKPIYPMEEADEEADRSENEDHTQAQGQVASTRLTPQERDRGQWTVTGGAHLSNGHASLLQHPGPQAVTSAGKKKAVAVKKKRAKTVASSRRSEQMSSGGESGTVSGRISIGDIYPQDNLGLELGEEEQAALQNQLRMMEDPEYANVVMTQMQDPEVAMYYHNQMLRSNPEYARIFFQQLQGSGDASVAVGGSGTMAAKSRRPLAKSAPPGGRRSSRKQRKKEKLQIQKEEKFDGTKTFPVEPEPTFYKDSNKAKLKLSSRKRHQQPLDPKFWMTVENDYLDI